MKYEKPPLSVSEQIARLESRGLSISDRDEAERRLSTISYYRFSAYTFPFREESSDNFKSGSTFEEALSRYEFDRELRLLIFDAIERIEIAFRTLVIYHASLHHNSAFWYEEESVFLDKSLHAEALARVDSQLEDSKNEIFIKHFNTKYGEGRPPAWMTIEICSFGLVSKLMQNLASYSIRTKIVDAFGISPIRRSMFEGWITCLVYVRNLCAHHSRLWNRPLTNHPGLLDRAPNPWIFTTGIDNRKAYYLLSVVLYLLKRVEPDTTFATRLKELLGRYAGIPLDEMGFPNNWETQPLWSS